MAITVRDIRERERRAQESKFEARHNDIPAVIKSVDGNTRPPGQQGMTWVSILNQPESRVLVRNATGMDIEGTPIWVGPETKPPFRLEVKGLYLGGISPSGGGSATSLSAGKHGSTHQYPSEANVGPDPVLIFQEAMQPLKCTGNGVNLIVTVQPLKYIQGGRPVKWGGGNVNLTSYVPTTSGKTTRVLVYLDEESNSLDVATGSEVTSGAVVEPPYPNVPVNGRPSAYIQLTYSQTAIVTATHIEDWRDFQNNEESYQATSSSELKNWTQTVVQNTSASGATNLDFQDGNIHELTLAGNIDLDFINPPQALKYGELTIKIQQSASGGNTVTWPTNVMWPGGTIPTMTSTANAIDVYKVFTTDAGLTYIGWTLGQNFPTMGDIVVDSLTLSGSAEGINIAGLIAISPLTLVGTAETMMPVENFLVSSSALTMAGTAKTATVALEITDPTDIAGLEVWLDASDLSTLYQDSGGVTPVTDDGQTVGYWADKSGNGNDFSQGTAANEPRYDAAEINGRSALYFDGSSDYLDSGAIAALNTDELTCIVVAVHELGSVDRLISCSYTSGAGVWSDDIWGIGSLSTGSMYNFSRSSIAVQVVNNMVANPFAGAFIVSHVWHSDDSVSGWVNGGIIANSTGANSSPSGHNLVRVGANIHTLGSYWQGHVAEVVIYSAELGDVDRVAIEKYLAKKWGFDHLDARSRTTIYSGSGSYDYMNLSAMVEADNGAWIAAYRLATDFNDLSNTLNVIFSGDYGENWTSPNTTLGGSAVSGMPANDHTNSNFVSLELAKAPNGDLLMLAAEDHSIARQGTWQWRSTDNGETWTDEGKILGDSLLVFTQIISVSTDMYAAVYIDRDNDGFPYKTSVYKSTDNGVTWAYLSDITSYSENTREAGLAHLGGNDMLALVFDSSAIIYSSKSTDLGVTWGSLTNVYSQTGGAAKIKLQKFDRTGNRLWLCGQLGPFNSYVPGLIYSDDDGDSWQSHLYGGNIYRSLAGTPHVLEGAKGRIYLFYSDGTTGVAPLTGTVMRLEKSDTVVLSSLTLSGTAENALAVDNIAIMNALTLVGSAETNAVNDGVAIMDALVIFGSAGSITLLLGEASISVNTLTLAGTPETSSVV